MPRITLSELLALVLDAGSFAEWGGELPAVAMPDAYAAELAAARAELAAVRATGLTSPGCASERLALATPLP